MADAKAIEAAKSQAIKDGAALERVRIRSIFDAEPAKGKEKLARHLALATDMSVDAAIAALTIAARDVQSATSPRATPVTASPQGRRIYRNMADANAAIRRGDNFTLDLTSAENPTTATDAVPRQPAEEALLAAQIAILSGRPLGAAL